MLLFSNIDVDNVLQVALALPVYTSYSNYCSK